MQLIVIGERGEVLDVLRSEAPQFTRTVPIEGAAKLLITIASREREVDAELALVEMEAASDVMITPANCAN